MLYKLYIYIVFLQAPLNIICWVLASRHHRITVQCRLWVDTSSPANKDRFMLQRSQHLLPKIKVRAAQGLVGGGGGGVLVVALVVVLVVLVVVAVAAALVFVIVFVFVSVFVLCLLSAFCFVRVFLRIGGHIPTLCMRSPFPLSRADGFCQSIWIPLFQILSFGGL